MAKNSEIVFSDKKYVTPPCEAAYAYLVQPDSGKYDPAFKITGVFDPKDSAVKAMVKDIQMFVIEYFKSLNMTPPKPLEKRSIIKKFLDRDKKDTGKISITFKTVPKKNDEGTGYIPVTVVDASKTAVKNGVWGGDTVRIAFGLGGWDSALGTGVKPYLHSVQRLTEVDRDRNKISVFDVEGEYISDDVDSSSNESGDLFDDTMTGNIEDVDQDDIV